MQATLASDKKLHENPGLAIPKPAEPRHLTWFAAIAMGYFVGAKVGFLLTVYPQPTSTLWPPNAILLAALLLTPRSQWWVLVAMIFPAHIAAQLFDNVPLSMTLSWFLTNNFEAIFAALSINYFITRQASNEQGNKDQFETAIDFGKQQHVACFLLFGVGLAPFLSSFIDISAVKFLNWGQGDYCHLWRTRFFSNALAALVLVPAIVTTAQRQSIWTSIKVKRRKIEGTLLMVATIAFCSFLFADIGLDRKMYAAMASALLPLLLWGALRFGPGYVSYLVLVVTSFAIWGAVHWQGPLIENSSPENVLMLQLFLIFTLTPIIFLTAVIGEWRRAETAERNHRSQLHMALTAARMDMWSWDIDSHRLHSTSLLLSDCREKSRHFDFEDFIQRCHPDDQVATENALRNAVDFGIPFELEVRVLGFQESSYSWIVSRCIPLRDESGKLYCISGVNIDISQRKQEAAQIQQQRDELSHLSRVAMLGEMSGAIAHELNQPLTAILCNAQAAQHILKRVFPQQHGIDEILEDIVSEDKRAGEIILRMRELLKKGEVHHQPLDINDVVRKVIVLEHSDLISRNIAVATDLSTDLPMAYADSVQIQQVLLNLIINGSDAMRMNSTNERLIKIHTCRDSENFVRIMVSDCGPGIETDRMETIFEPFYTTKSHGLGLGLTICRSIVIAHGGNLWVTNNDHIGATFHVTLPIHG